VERALLARIRKKAALYARELDMHGDPLENTSNEPVVDGTSGGDQKGAKPVTRSERFKIDIDAVEHLYAKYLIPLTKEVEVRESLEYLYGYSSAGRLSICCKGLMDFPRTK